MQTKTFIVVAAALSLAAAQAPPTLTAALNATSDLSTLNSLLAAQPAILAVLGNATNITVFAPSNAAFEALTSSPDYDTLTADAGFIPSLLTYHVLNATVFSQNITTTPNFVKTLLTNATYSNVTGGQVVGARLSSDENGNVTITSGYGQTANVVTADVEVTNGVVHIIDSVLTIPANVGDTALAAGLTALVGALEATNLTDTLNGLSDVTVFAPTNAAFEAIGSALGSLTAEQATSILEYHVINGTVAYSSLLSNTSIKALSGQSLNITIEDGEVFVNSARVIAADVLVSGGVVHVIDAVLNANSTQAPNPEESSGVPLYSGASSADVPYTSSVPTASTTISVATTDAVAESYTPAPTDALSSASQSVADSTSTTSGIAVRATGVIGAAALFGGAAVLANM